MQNNGVPQQQASNPMQVVQQLSAFMNGKNPQQVAMNMIQQNPKFAEFMKSVQGKTPEQFAQEHGVNISQIMGMMKR